MVHIPPKPPTIGELSTSLSFWSFPLNIREEGLLYTLNPPLIHPCNYKFSTVWKTLVDNFLPLRIKRVES